jgi:hypothetical protein
MELKTAAIKDKKYKCKRGEQITNGCMVWIEHIRIDVTGVEGNKQYPCTCSQMGWEGGKKIKERERARSIK